MNYQKLFKTTFQGKSNTNLATVAVVGGVVIGIAIGTLFATKKGKTSKAKIIDFFATLTGKSSKKITNGNLGNLIENVRDHVKQNATKLIDLATADKDIIAIKVDEAGTSKWKEQKETVIFPNDVNPKLSQN